MTTKRFSALCADGPINPTLQLRSGQVVPCKDKVKIPTLRQKRSGWGTRQSKVKSYGKAGYEREAMAAAGRPASLRIASARSVRSQVKPGPVRPKWPYEAVSR